MKTIALITLFILTICSYSQTAQYKTVFNPETVTYNGSDNPNECWESVEQGILIEVDGITYFFTMYARGFESLCEQLKGQEVVVDVIHSEESDYGSGADGSVQKITLNGVVVYPTIE